ncbi:MAG: YabP/YqfC family sporulation protein [Oscillospiraceae bacterium]
MAQGEDRGLQQPHKLSLDERKKLTVSGVAEVVSFEENAVVLRTSRGTLLVRGQDLHLKTYLWMGTGCCRRDRHSAHLRGAPAGRRIFLPPLRLMAPAVAEQARWFLWALALGARAGPGV